MLRERQCLAEATSGSVATRRRAIAAGFTLIELIIVVTIIGLLAGIAVVNVRNAQRRAAENVLKADLAALRKAIDDFYADKQRFPSSLEDLVLEHYIRSIPIDPITKKSDTWTTKTGDPGDPSAIDPLADPSAPPGIVDVHSGAEGTTLDGVAYTDL